MLTTHPLTSTQFHPLPQSNRRAAVCRDCRKRLAAGEAVAWEYARVTGYVYFCEACSDKRTAQQAALDAASDSIAAICAALHADRPLGFMDKRRVLMALKAKGSRMPDVAQAVAERIAELEAIGETPNIWIVESYIEVL